MMNLGRVGSIMCSVGKLQQAVYLAKLALCSEGLIDTEYCDARQARLGALDTFICRVVLIAV